MLCGDRADAPSTAALSVTVQSLRDRCARQALGAVRPKLRACRRNARSAITVQPSWPVARHTASPMPWLAPGDPGDNQSDGVTWHRNDSPGTDAKTRIMRRCRAGLSILQMKNNPAVLSQPPRSATIAVMIRAPATFGIDD